jgi:tetratricopeptide (TPR) repeat protein
MALERTGGLEEAAERYREAADADPTDVLPHIRRALVLQRLGLAAEAAGELEKVIAAEPDNADALLRLAQLREFRGERKAALGHYQALLALDLGDEVDRAVHANLGDLLAESDPAAAATHYAAAVRLGAPGEDLRLREARALLRANRDQEARSRLEEGRRELPDADELTHLLARLQASSEDAAVRDGERSLELATAVFERKKSAERAETVAMSLAELGRFPEAVAWQRRIIEQLEAAHTSPVPDATRARLRSYEEGQPCRAPWRTGG